MFAVIKTGGKQYRVAKDDKLVVEKLPGEAGDVVELGNVLMIGGEGGASTVGTPFVEKAAVFAEVLAQTKGDKVLVFKKRRRKNSRRLNGHRQNLTLLRVLAVSPTGEKPAIEAKAKAEPKPKKAAKAEKSEE